MPEAVKTISQAWVLFAALCAVAAAGFLAYKSYAEAMRQTAEGWKLLAEQKSAVIVSLEQRIGQLESRMGSVQAENDALRRLNMAHQAEILELREQLRTMEARLHAMEV